MKLLKNFSHNRGKTNRGMSKKLYKKRKVIIKRTRYIPIVRKKLWNRTQHQLTHGSTKAGRVPKLPTNKMTMPDIYGGQKTRLLIKSFEFNSDNDVKR